jgi:nucleoid-associated protein YgaU
LIYIFVGVGAAIAVIALAVTLLDDGEQAMIEPQSDASQTATVKPQAGAASVTGTQQTATVKDDVSGSADAPAATADPAGGVANDDVVPEAGDPAIAIDLAQVRPDGNAVFAGKATPYAEVTVFEGDVILGRTKADENGEWVIIPEAALGAGEHLVSVGAVSEDGTSSVADVTMAIQVGETSEERPLVALLPQSETDIPELLQSPDDTPATPVDLAKSDIRTAETGSETPGQDAPMMPAIAPRSLSWKAGGELVIAGVSRGGVRVDAVADGVPFGAGATMTDGGWQLAGTVDMTKSTRKMLFTLRDADDVAIATYELPVTTRDLSQGLDGSRMVIVQRGDALWRIAYSSYGEGIRYVDIVRRNASAIDDPDLIFPNQIFAVPQKP